MDKKQLYEAVGQVDESLLARTEQRARSKRPWWMGAAAAAAVIAVVGAAQLYQPITVSAKAIREAEYPEMAPYTTDFSNSQAYEAWWNGVIAQQGKPGYADGLEHFFTNGTRKFLSGTETENRIVSPVNLYMALSMLAETTDGASRQQLLELLGSSSIEDLRRQAKELWNAQYRGDGAVTSVLANSIWLNEDLSFVPETMDILAESYYASSFQGEMGSDSMDRLLQKWLSEQTGGMLDRQSQDVHLDADTVLALSSATQFRAKWDYDFQKENTKPGIFHSASGDRECDFMHSREQGTYYWSENFGAVSRSLANKGGTMWFLLPDEGISPEELLTQEATFSFLAADGRWKDQKYLNIELSLPKFDVSSQLDLKQGLQELGIRDVFDSSVSDFTPLTAEAEGIHVSSVRHDARVTVDEEGVSAAAYTLMHMPGAGRPPEDEMEFVLDRPFLFAINSSDGLPLFVGIVNQPR